MTTLSAQTLCSQYGNSSFTYTVGVGSSGNILNSSQLGFSLPSGSTVNVVGDFNISGNFNLTNAIVKVAPNAKITILTYNALSLNNTKVFACTGLWKGIEMQSLTSITVTNNSQIEDAENAIKAINTSYVGLSIDNSIFNRNKVGINLEDTGTGGYWVVPPMINYFVNNKFTCTSALNGGGSTEIGLRLKNVYYPLAFNYGNEKNEFKELQNGIYIEGEFCNFTMYRYKFSKNTLKDVYFKGKYLNVQLCSFLDIKKRGLVFENSEQLIVENSYFNILEQSIQDRIMVECLNPISGHSFRMYNNNFYSIGILSQGIHFLNNDFLNAEVASNNFYHFGLSAGHTLIGINIYGNHSTLSNVQIFNNYFNFENDFGRFETSGFYNVGIYSIGNRNNFKILHNSFETGDGVTARIEGSTGNNNEFSENTWNLGGTYTATQFGAFFDNFHNTRICSNFNYSAANPTFSFRNFCPSTDFINNFDKTFWPFGAVGLFVTSVPGITPVMGIQEHKGNQWLNWTNGLQSTVRIENYANTPAQVALSQFRVHTTQPTQFFPPNVSTPNAPGSVFFNTTSGVPSIGCVFQAPNPIGEDPVLDPLIAQSRFSEYTQNTAQVYDAELHLMRKVKNNQSVYNGNQTYKNFIQKHQGKSKEKIRNIEDAIDENTKIDEVTKNKINVRRNKIKLLEDDNKKFNKDKRPNKDEMQAYYKQRLELDEGISALYNEHKSNKKIKDKNAKNIADNIVPTTLQERLTKEVYQIYLDAQINYDGKYTDAQRARMKQIAATCFTEGGMIVYVARGYLTYEDYKDIQKDIEICEPRQNLDTQLNNNSLLQIGNNKTTKMPIIFPNPTKESVTINLTKDIEGSAAFMDLTGKLISTYKLTTGDNTIIHGLSNGIYLVTIKTSDGQVFTQKLSVNN